MKTIYDENKNPVSIELGALYEFSLNKDKEYILFNEHSRLHKPYIEDIIEALTLLKDQLESK